MKATVGSEYVIVQDGLLWFVVFSMGFVCVKVVVGRMTRRELEGRSKKGSEGASEASGGDADVGRDKATIALLCMYKPGILELSAVRAE